MHISGRVLLLPIAAILLFALTSCSSTAEPEDYSALYTSTPNTLYVNTVNIEQTNGQFVNPDGNGVFLNNENGTTQQASETEPADSITTPETMKQPVAQSAYYPQGNDLATELQILNKPIDRVYQVHRGDVMEISIPFEADSSRVVTVRPDGHIGYLYDIDIQVAGLTYQELNQKLNKSLEDYYYNPKVSINSKVFSGSQVYLMGPIERPGPVSIQNNTRLLEVLAAAGVMRLLPNDNTIASYSNSQTTNDVVDLKNAYMMRNGKILPVNFYSLLMKKDMRHNIYVHPDDFIFFPSSYLSDVTKRVYICGAVNQPKVYTFTTYGTLMAALSSSSGIDKYRADAAHCVILRRTAKKLITASYYDIVSGKAPDIELQESDIIYVPERGLYESAKWTTTIVNEILGPVQSLIQSSTASKSINNQNWSPTSGYGAVDYFNK